MEDSEVPLGVDSDVSLSLTSMSAGATTLGRGGEREGEVACETVCDDDDDDDDVVVVADVAVAGVAATVDVDVAGS